MAEHEAIFKGSAADFARFVDDFERRRRNGSTVFHVPDLRRGYVDIWPPESKHEAWLAAYDLPGERALVECETLSPAAWPDIEPHWQELLSEARRLDALESDAAPEPVAEPEPAREKPKRGRGNRSRYTDKERREACEQYRQLGGGMTQDDFMSERYGGMSGRALRDWLAEFGL